MFAAQEWKQSKRLKEKKEMKKKKNQTAVVERVPDQFSHLSFNGNLQNQLRKFNTSRRRCRRRHKVTTT